MASKSKKKTAALAPQPDPRAPVDSQLLLQHLVPALKALEQDLVARADDSPGLTEALQKRWEAECSAERTADPFNVWRRGIVTQVAAAWVLSCVFVRILEDRGLLAQCRIAGPGAEGMQQEFLKLAPFLTERDYLLLVFRELCHFDVTRELFDREHNLVWQLNPSAEGARSLLAIFRQGSAEAPAFRFGQADTRFLGDLYQDLSDEARQKYALLQTPDFVEEFILDRTLDPALEQFGLDGSTLLDPTCGSGHFLLGAFERLYERQLTERPNLNPRDAAQRALEAVFGVDINRYAVTISKFRLVLAFLEKGEYFKLEGAHRPTLHVATADSLYHKVPEARPGEADSTYGPEVNGEDGLHRPFALEELDEALPILAKRHSAVVGNPPYITVKDKALRAAYKKKGYESAYREYSLAAPFTERFFDLARVQGHVGMITANSFMKREFGKKLIEHVLPQRDLQLVVNTSGAYIPGHGTPTVLLFGRSRPPATGKVQAVLAKRSEPSTPEIAACGKVWSSIAEHWREDGYDDDYISVVNIARASLSKHPWSLGGGGANDLKALLEERAEFRLADKVASVGFMCITKQDEVFSQSIGVFERQGVEDGWLGICVIGEHVRDWSIDSDMKVFFPYAQDGEVLDLDPCSNVTRFLWPYRCILEARAVFGGRTFKEAARRWYEYGQIPRDRISGPAIVFAEVATHNHFVLDHGGRVFNRTAPIIKLSESATADDHYALIAYLNSSTACFWMKQVVHKKTNASQKHTTDPARASYQFSGTALKPLPLFGIPERQPDAHAIAKELTAVGEGRAAWSTGALFSAAAPKVLGSPTTLQTFLEKGWGHYDQLTCRGVYLQEELDWLTYEAAGFLRAGEAGVSLAPGVGAALGARPFELEDGYDSGVTTRVGAAMSAACREPGPKSWQRRQALLKRDGVCDIERREYKRMWRDTEANVDQARYRVELPHVWVRSFVSEKLEDLVRTPECVSVAGLEQQLSGEALRTAAEYLDRSPREMVAQELLANAVPYLSSLLFTETGLEKRQEWERVWRLQRQEDGGSKITIPVPPEYSQGSRGKSTDFRSATYWRLRGKLDVPKERFISYAGCESDEDGSPVYGWAGWNHLQRAVALSGLYQKRRDEGWAGERLLPMLVGLLELFPWLKQWYDEPDEELGGERPAAQFEAFVQSELQTLKKTPEEAKAAVLAWVEAGGGKYKKETKNPTTRKKQGTEAAAKSKKKLAKTKAGEAPANEDSDEGAAA